MPAPGLILELVERFGRNRDTYRSTHYNETQARREFIDPFFEALGWDLTNRLGYAEAYKDVVHEAAVRVGAAIQAPDYSFGIAANRKFFVEAKRPGIDLDADPAPAFQLRSYGYSAKFALSILTDFAEFAVYDCRIKPRPSDKPHQARAQYLTFDQYPAQWDQIAAVFSREAVLRGAFDQYAADNKPKGGTAEVDDDFLAEIESWRDQLARQFATRNTLSVRELNFAVQRTIDRIIFLRIAEDRGTEPPNQLFGLLSGDHVYERLGQLYRRADEKYNSGLFHFTREKGRAEAPDEFTPGLSIDDKVLKAILHHLYDSPYRFNVFPADILGQVYEQFLGKVIRLTPAGHAKVEDKPEVKKAGGVYYTPTYIVDYIVQNTVGQLLEGKTPKEAAKLRLLDPACGSGSFLIGAYQHLLDWHLNWYAAHEPDQWLAGKNPPIYEAIVRAGEDIKSIRAGACRSGRAVLSPKHEDGGPSTERESTEAGIRAADGPTGPARSGSDSFGPAEAGSGPCPPDLAPTPRHFRLTTAERKRILLNSIFGVDIDPQAVEVTKLSLLLKVLEGESQQTLERQYRFFHERALPDLGANIKCGNSLIGPDFYEGQQLAMFDDEERLRINVFDWSGPDGFPAILKAGGFDAVIGNPPYGFHQIHADYVKPYLKQAFASSHGSFEHYFLFYERSLSLLRRGGRHGFIVPVTWLTIPSAHALRKFVLEAYAVERIVWLPKLVFRNAQVNTLVSVISRNRPGPVRIEIHQALGFVGPPAEVRTADQSAFVADDYYIGIFADAAERELVRKVTADGVPLGELARPCSGYNPYEVGAGTKPEGGPQTAVTVRTKPYHSPTCLGPEWKPEIVGRDLDRYSIRATRDRWVRYGPWLAAPRDPGNFVGPRILVQEVVGGKDRRITAAFCDRELYHSRDVIPIKTDVGPYSPLFLLGVLNSRLATWYHHKRNPKAKKELFPKVLVSDLRNVPICRVDLTSSADKARHDRIVTLVDTMLRLHQQLSGARTEHEATALRRQIAATDRQIDALVYELYGLTADDIRLVESAGAGAGAAASAP